MNKWWKTVKIKHCQGLAAQGSLWPLPLCPFLAWDIEKVTPGTCCTHAAYYIGVHFLKAGSQTPKRTCKILCE